MIIEVHCFYELNINRNKIEMRCGLMQMLRQTKMRETL